MRTSVAFGVSLGVHGLVLLVAATAFVVAPTIAPPAIIVSLRPVGGDAPGSGHSQATTVVIEAPAPAPVAVAPPPARKVAPRLAPRVAPAQPIAAAVAKKPAPRAAAALPSNAAVSGSPNGKGSGPTVATGNPGHGSASGRGGRGAVGAGRAGALDAYLSLVRARIEGAKLYPLLARRRGIEGRVALSFVIGPDGDPEDLAVDYAGHPLLAAAARQAVTQAAPFPVVPAGLGERNLRVAVPLRFSLEDS